MTIPLRTCITFLGATLAFLLVSCSGVTTTAIDNHRTPETWTFVSMPDFLNVDVTYPQSGWENALDYVLKAVKAENPDFVLIAGDLVMGRWWTREKIAKYANIYYPDWIKRMNDHGLKFYTAIGDHELGDNPWPPDRAKLVPFFKAAFRDHMKMPLNGPDHMKGTAFYFLHKNTLFVAVDVFEKGKSSQGEIAPQVTGKQLKWLEKTLDAHRSVDNVVVMGHTPILGPVRKRSSSGLILQRSDAPGRPPISSLEEHVRPRRRSLPVRRSTRYDMYRERRRAADRSRRAVWVQPES